MGSSELQRLPPQNSFGSPTPAPANDSTPASPSAEKKPGVEIQPPLSEISRLASIGSGIPQSPWRKFNPLWFSPLNIFSLGGCGNDICKVGECPEEVNQKPQFEALSSKEIEVGKSLSFFISAPDPEGSEVTIEIGNGSHPFPQGAVLRRRESGKFLFAWTPKDDQIGFYDVEFEASDGSETARQDMGVTVVPSNSGDTSIVGNKDGGIVHDSGSVDSGQINSDGTLDSDGGEVLTDAGQSHEDGGINICDQLSTGVGLGTPQSPYSFKILVMVEQATKEAAEANGWDVEAGVLRDIGELNAGFNNGQLRNSYQFTSIGTRYIDIGPNWSTYRPHPSDTPEDEDFILFYNEKDTSSPHAGDKYVAITGANAFGPTTNLHPLINHEFAHLRGAIDLYTLKQDGKDNLVFPGASYVWEDKSYMAQGSSGGRNWDPLTVELLSQTESDPSKSAACAYNWIRSWTPDSINIQITDGNGQPVPNAQMDLYRRKPGYELNQNHLWFSGTSDSQGFLQLPEGLMANYPDAGWVYYLFLAAVSVENESYLNWYNVLDIAVPYRQGIRNLILPAKIDSTTHFTASVPMIGDLDLEVVGFTSNSVIAGDSFQRYATVRNLGPDFIQGNIGIQFYLSADSILDLEADIPFGGYNKTVDLALSNETTISNNPSVPSTLLPGNYYLIASVEHKTAGASDPNDSNNVRASDHSFTVLAP